VVGKIAEPRPIFDEFRALVDSYSEELSPFKKEFLVEEEEAKFKSLKEQLVSY